MPPPRPRRRSEIDEDLRSYIDSQPPPKQLAAALERLEARIAAPNGIVTQTGKHDIEELQDQLRQMIERGAAERLEAEARRAERAELELQKLQEQVEKTAEKRDDRWFQVGLVVLAAILGAVLTHFVEAGVRAPPAIVVEPPRHAAK